MHGRCLTLLVCVFEFIGSTGMVGDPDLFSHTFNAFGRFVETPLGRPPWALSCYYITSRQTRSTCYVLYIKKEMREYEEEVA